MMELKKDKAVTIQDIAQKLNIAASTVSRALKNNPRISEATKHKVWQTAKLLGYKSHLKEAHFYSVNTKNIAVILPHLKTYLFRNFMSGIQKIAKENEYNIFMFFSENSEEKEAEFAELITDLRIDGLIFSFLSYSNDTVHINNLIETKIPLVSYNTYNLNLPVPKLVLDHYQSGFKAVNHFVSVGCNKIAQLLGVKDNPVYKEVINGHKAALEKHNIPFNDDYIIYSDLTEDDVESALNILLNLPEVPNGIVVKNNLVALQVLSFLKKSQIKVPQDISVMSYENDDFNKYLSPSISTITFSAQKIGEKAAGMLFKEIQNYKSGKEPEDITVIESAKLVIRSSSMRE